MSQHPVVGATWRTSKEAQKWRFHHRGPVISGSKPWHLIRKILPVYWLCWAWNVDFHPDVCLERVYGFPEMLVQVSLLNEHHSANSIKLKLARRCGWWNCAIAMWKKPFSRSILGLSSWVPIEKNMVPASRRPPWVRNMVSFSLGWTQRWQGDGLQWSWRHDQSEFIEISRRGWRIWHHFFFSVCWATL